MSIYLGLSVSDASPSLRNDQPLAVDLEQAQVVLHYAAHHFELNSSQASESFS